MKIFLRASILIVALTVTLGACVNNQPSNVANNNPANTASPAPQPAPATARVNATDESALPVTLPVLDAFFADESFAPALKSKLQLTDEQIGKLRTLAREETAKLRETDADDYSGTTAAARSHAAEQIKAAIGEEKAQQLSQFLRQRWSGTEEGEGNASDQQAAHGSTGKMNAVPTDSRIVVNAPAYRMDVFENGQLVKSYKVGIGYPEFPLPTGTRKAATIIFNPTWTPPDEPWVESANKVKPGEKIEAGSKLNPLGPIKIPIGLPSLIHGGKSQAKLGGFASHGCVGLTTPQVQSFARMLAQMGGTELTDEQIVAYAKTPKETKDVKLNHAVTVELRYETIVVEEGKLHIYRDVYDRDTNTEENLRSVLAAYNVTLEQLSEQERTAVMNALKEMSRDASGKNDASQVSNNSNTSTNTAQTAKTSNRNENKKAENPEGKVTRAVRGKKEIVVEIAALKGKGYPAPVEFDTGSGAKKQPAANTPKGKRS
ncbi:MAG: L,D-transpeptidase ErfK/SrfK [Acidobacteriota bacterium]|jgi:lipoprotein-anchoring transpeptidase ErfK/SrfK|nr:L,D-transpeptidase ErfK/SrfK [Acidobacteriota bacterium]